MQQFIVGPTQYPSPPPPAPYLPAPTTISGVIRILTPAIVIMGMIGAVGLVIKGVKAA